MDDSGRHLRGSEPFLNMLIYPGAGGQLLAHEIVDPQKTNNQTLNSSLEVQLSLFVYWHLGNQWTAI